MNAKDLEPLQLVFPLRKQETYYFEKEKDDE